MQTEPAMPRSSQSKPEFSTQAARFAAIRARDPRADGRFYYSVATTGVYCRPSCAARRALARNVAFHETAAEAERAGFRPCKRCRPTEPPQEERHARLVQSLRARIEASEQPVVLEQLAAGAGLSPFYLHRLFKKHVGMTPREYAAACRLQRVGDGLRAGATVTTAIYDAGYSSSSRFYEAAGSSLGITPSDLRRGASGVELRATVRGCSLGYVLIAVTSRGVCAISFGEDAPSLLDELRERFPRATVHGSDARLEAIADEVVGMVDSAGVATDLPLDLLGTAFQQRVWRALRDIPRGTTSTYAEVAERIGAPHAARAVGTACGKNPVAVAVPCHRVVRDDGSLGGYRWGLHRKKALLDRERSR